MCASFSSLATSDAPSQSPLRAYPPNRQLYEYVVRTRPGEERMRSNWARACDMSSARPAMVITWWLKCSSTSILYTSTRRLASALASRQRRAPSNAASVSPAVMASGRTPGSSRIALNTSPASSHRRDSRSTVNAAVYTNMFRGSPIDAQSFHTWYAAGQFSHRPSAVIAALATSELMTDGSNKRRWRHTFVTIFAWPRSDAAPKSATSVYRFGTYLSSFCIPIHRYSACARSKLPRSPSSLIAKLSVGAENLTRLPSGIVTASSTLLYPELDSRVACLLSLSSAAGMNSSSSVGSRSTESWLRTAVFLSVLVFAW